MRRGLLACLTACGSFGTTPENNGTPKLDGDAGPGAVDSGPSADGGALDGSDCPKRPTFKDEFERPNGDIFDDWSNYNLKNGGTLAIDAFGGLNGAAALKVALQPSSDGAAALKKDLPPNGTCPVHISFVYKANSFPSPGGQVSLAQVVYALGELEIRIVDNQLLQLNDDLNNGSGIETSLGFQLNVNERTEMSFVFDTRLKKVFYELRRQSGTVVGGSVPITNAYDVPLAAWIGGDNVKSAGAFSYFLDDVVIE